MQPRPCGLVTLQPEHPLQAHSTRTVLLAGDPPRRPEPQRQGLARYPGKPSPPSPNLGSRNPRTPEGLQTSANSSAHCNVGSETRQASGAETDTPGRPSPSRSEPQIRADPAENPPPEAILQVVATGVK